MAKHYLVMMRQTAVGPRIEHKALKAGWEYDLTDATVRALTGLEAKDPRVKTGYKDDVLEIKGELTDDEIQGRREAEAEALKKA